MAILVVFATWAVSPSGLSEIALAIVCVSPGSKGRTMRANPSVAT
jgi:hypothetical protein